MSFSETWWVVRTKNGLEFDSALEEAGDESARCAGYSAKSRVIGDTIRNSTESWVVPRE